MIAINIDVKKIEKAALFVGQKGTYLNLTLMDSKDGTDQYGNDGFVVQDIGKERRQGTAASGRARADSWELEDDWAVSATATAAEAATACRDE